MSNLYDETWSSKNYAVFLRQLFEKHKKLKDPNYLIYPYQFGVYITQELGYEIPEELESQIIQELDNNYDIINKDMKAHYNPNNPYFSDAEITIEGIAGIFNYIVSITDDNYSLEVWKT